MRSFCSGTARAKIQVVLIRTRSFFVTHRIQFGTGDDFIRWFQAYLLANIKRRAW